MDSNALSLLVEIIDAGSLSKAAARMGMSRANASHRLAQFERQLGQQLMRRTTRRIEPTELGWKLYEHGCNIRHEMQAARESVDTLGKALQGRVRLSVPSGYGQQEMSGWLTEFMLQHPGITLEVIFDNAIEDLMAGAVDCAVRVMTEPPTHLVARNLGRVNYVVCAAPELIRQYGMPQTLQELIRLPLVTSSLTEQALRLAGYQSGQRELDLRMRLVSPNFYFLRDALLRGLGAGVVPDYMVRAFIASGDLVHVPIDEESLAFLSTFKFLLHMPSHYPTRALATLMDFLLEKAASHPV